MSEGLLQSFNINELAGATGLILGGVSGLLVVIFKSRCYCKFRIGCSDDCSLCMCSRSPPPDSNIENNDPDDADDDDKKNILPKNKSFKKSKTSEGQAQQRALGPEPQSESPDIVNSERLIPSNDDIDRLV
jgi:hypothetical protein